MKKNYIEFAAKKLVGISVRTNNANEMTADKAQIGKTIGNFYSESLTDQIGTKTNPGVIYSVYTNYDSDHTGDYTYFVGEEVDAFEAHNTLEQLEIPAQKYAVFTAGPAPMPQVIIEAWQAIFSCLKLRRDL